MRAAAAFFQIQPIDAALIGFVLGVAFACAFWIVVLICIRPQFWNGAGYIGESVRVFDANGNEIKLRRSAP